MKSPSWRIGVEVSNFHIVDVEACTVEEAQEKAIIEVRKDDEFFCTGKAVGITSCFINDRNSNDYAKYVPELMPKQQRVG